LPAVGDRYEVRDGLPSVETYLALRAAAGLSGKQAAQARVALRGTWGGCLAVSGGGEVVGMGRIVGDGGWYFQIVDMAVLPGHQRRGIGGRLLARLLELIDESAPPDAYVGLFADPPGQRLYEQHGFAPSAPASIGMVRAAGLGHRDGNDRA
jgi:GNAT superfamily N-acetyltransferase